MLNSPPPTHTHTQLTLLDGVAFKDKGGEGRLLSDDELRSCFKLSNHRDEPLLAFKAAVGGSSGGGAIKPAAGGMLGRAVQIRCGGGR